MTIWAWLLLSIPLGALVCIVLLNVLLKTPASRIWLNERLSWSNQTLPPHCHALVRHGKWVAKRSSIQHRPPPTIPAFVAQPKKRP